MRNLEDADIALRMFLRCIIYFGNCKINNSEQFTYSSHTIHIQFWEWEMSFGSHYGRQKPIDDMNVFELVIFLLAPIVLFDSIDSVVTRHYSLLNHIRCSKFRRNSTCVWICLSQRKCMSTNMTHVVRSRSSWFLRAWSNARQQLILEFIYADRAKTHKFS